MKYSPKKILFFYLRAFSQTGGIEKFNRCLIKGLNDLSSEINSSFKAMGAYDSACDERYISNENCKGFSGDRINAFFSFVREGLKGQLVILGHINLAPVGIFIKLLNPRSKLVLIVHGVESWSKLRGSRKWCMRKADLILAVSNYTKNQVILKNNIQSEKIRLFPNTLDPFFKIPAYFAKPEYLIDRYGLSKQQRVIFTLSRLKSSEQNKGYDRVIRALPEILKEIPDCIYILAGKLEPVERERLLTFLKTIGLEDRVILAGFIDDVEVSDHYQLADVFILPSRKEGFGIVFLEALANGTPVIGGNQDGTVDALYNGALGQLINPTRQAEIVSALVNQLSNNAFPKGRALQEQVSERYQFCFFKNRLKHICEELIPE